MNLNIMKGVAFERGGSLPPHCPCPCPCPSGEPPVPSPSGEPPVPAEQPFVPAREPAAPSPPPAGAKPDVPEKKKQKQSTLALCMRPDGLPDVVPATASIQKSPELQQLQLDLIVRFV
jgi:hypothetical protein